MSKFFQHKKLLMHETIIMPHIRVSCVREGRGSNPSWNCWNCDEVAATYILVPHNLAVDDVVKFAQLALVYPLAYGSQSRCAQFNSYYSNSRERYVSYETPD